MSQCIFAWLFNCFFVFTSFVWQLGVLLGNLNALHGLGFHALFDVYLSELNFKVVFALDFSKTVSTEDFQKEFRFSQDISSCWKLPSESAKTALVVYGEGADTVPIDVHSMVISVPHQSDSEFRRMDLALIEAATHFSENPTQQKLIVLITAGKQLSGAEGSEDDQERLESISEALCSSKIKVIIVPVGWETDFKELGLIVKRPQSLFPLECFDDMTRVTAEKIATAIKATIGEILLSCYKFKADIHIHTIRTNCTCSCLQFDLC